MIFIQWADRGKARQFDEQWRDLIQLIDPNYMYDEEDFILCRFLCDTLNKECLYFLLVHILCLLATFYKELYELD